MASLHVDQNVTGKQSQNCYDVNRERYATAKKKRYRFMDMVNIHGISLALNLQTVQ